MRKIYLFLLLALSIILVGCSETITKVVAIKVAKVEMSSEVEEVIYTINIVNEDLITEKNNIIKFNYYYSFGKLPKC